MGKYKVSDYEAHWSISVKKTIAVDKNKLWNIISKPSNLELFHAYCKENKIVKWPGKGSIDLLTYDNGITYKREFIEWTENSGYALFIGAENKPKSYVRWELASINEFTEIKISVAPYFMINIPKIISFLPFKIYIEPMLKKYLRVVLNGLNDYADPKLKYKKNRFKYHPWFC